MIVCINAGGKGSRLWPLSTNDSPKQTQKLTNNKTLIENIYNLAKRITSEVFIVSEISHSDKVQKLTKIDKKKLIVEPERKGTLNCTLFAVSYINKFYNGKKKDEQICFIHADHVYDNNDTFVKDIKNVGISAAKHDNILIASTKPTYPSNKFGYIEQVKYSKDVYKAVKFIEKPDVGTAKKLIKTKKYVWNEGLFVCSYNTLLKTIKNHKEILKVFNGIDKNIKNIKKIYPKLKNECIEVGLYYKVDKLLIYPINFKWTDIGTYSSLYEISSKDKDGNVAMGTNIRTIDCFNNLIINRTNTPIVVIGKNNCIVVNTKKGLLIVDKANEDKIKQI